ncbi:MAG TPA: Rho termination factor N-terminal domain-containing protein [Desulfuromonadaceae bacterium]
MKLEEIKEIAKQHGIKAGKMKKAELVRSIQQAEGNTPCFATGASLTCGQGSCLWREDCD